MAGRSAAVRAAESLARQGQVGAAVSACYEALALDHKEPYTHALLSHLFLEGDFYDEAIAEATAAIERDLGGHGAFKEAFTKAAQTRFGSGWAWLTLSRDGKLLVESSPNQDNPLMGDFAGLSGGTPILGLDVWEHAYYLNYQNRRPDYIAAFFELIDWAEVARRYQAAGGR